MLIDTHAHLDFSQFSKDRDQVLQKARKAGVGQIINIGVDLQSSEESISLAREHSFIFATVGVHPHDAKDAPPDYLERLKSLASLPKVVAIGEIGLDYYRNRSPRKQQQRVFREQLRLARSLSLPVVVHDRDAHTDLLKILEEELVEDISGVMHCFSGDRAMADRCLALNMYISLAGPLTFKRSDHLKDLASYLPLERVLLETDSPFLAPQPYRGRRNEPANLLRIASCLAQLKNINLEEIADRTTENAFTLFGCKQGDE